MPMRHIAPMDNYHNAPTGRAISENSYKITVADSCIRVIETCPDGRESLVGTFPQAADVQQRIENYVRAAVVIQRARWVCLTGGRLAAGAL